MKKLFFGLVFLIAIVSAAFAAEPVKVGFISVLSGPDRKSVV